MITQALPPGGVVITHSSATRWRGVSKRQVEHKLCQIVDFTAAGYLSFLGVFIARATCSLRAPSVHISLASCWVFGS